MLGNFFYLIHNLTLFFLKKVLALGVAMEPYVEGIDDYIVMSQNELRQQTFDKFHKELFAKPQLFQHGLNIFQDLIGIDPTQPQHLPTVIPKILEKFPEHRFTILDSSFELLQIFQKPSDLPNNQYDDKKCHFFVLVDSHLYWIAKPNWRAVGSYHCCTCFRRNCENPDERVYQGGNCDYLKRFTFTGLDAELLQDPFEMTNDPDALNRQRILEKSLLRESLRSVNCPSCVKPIYQNNSSDGSYQPRQRIRQLPMHYDCSPHIPLKENHIPFGSNTNRWYDSFIGMSDSFGPLPPTLEGLKDSSVVMWVWDIESKLVPRPYNEVFYDRPPLDEEEEDMVVYEHEANLVKVVKCFTNPSSPVIYTFATLTEFMHWLLGMDEHAHDPFCPGYSGPAGQSPYRQNGAPQPQHLFLAHNAKGYDNRLLLDTIKKEFYVGLHQRNFHTMYDGNKLLSLSFSNAVNVELSFRDSLSHLPMALRSLPKAFGIVDTEIMLGDQTYRLEKGEFPYMFNVPGHEEYDGPMPPKSYFELERMSKSRKLEVETWYDETVERLNRDGGTWNFQKELDRYCELDCVVLKSVVELYYYHMYKLHNVNPWQKITLPSYCATIFFNRYIPHSVLEIPNSRGRGGRLRYENPLRILSIDQMKFAQQALRGGRTDVRQRYTKGKMKYVDIVSLYPYVQFTKEYPTGTPMTHWDYDLTLPEDLTTLEWETYSLKCSIVKIDIDVVKYIHHPVLVCNCPSSGFKFVDEEKTAIDCTKKDGKLVAVLYNMRNLTTTGAELFYALKSGVYKLLKIHRADIYTPRSDLFTKYYQKCFTEKIYASGYQGREEDWEQFKREAFELLGIILDRNKMCRNEGMRLLAKFCANSLWGKLVQNAISKMIYMGAGLEDMQEYITQNYNGFVETSMSSFITVGPYNPDQAQYIETECTLKDYRPVAAKSSYPVGVYVAAWGRLELWKTLHQLGERVVYHDTDSIIYHYDEENPENNVKEGSQLGEWEAEEDGAFITEIACVAPKMYAYKVENREGQPKIKLKGVQLSVSTDDQVNFDFFKDLAMGIPPEDNGIEQLKFEWLRSREMMVTYLFKKSLAGRYDKGIIDPRTFKTYSFGSERFIDINTNPLHVTNI